MAIASCVAGGRDLLLKSMSRATESLAVEHISQEDAVEAAGAVAEAISAEAPSAAHQGEETAETRHPTDHQDSTLHETLK